MGICSTSKRQETMKTSNQYNYKNSLKKTNGKLQINSSFTPK